jgi:hypothetical protein
MSTVDGGKSAPRCNHCGREVAETVHTRSAYRVDYYALHTGEVEPTTMPSRDDASQVITVLKLLRPSDIVTCADCYRQPSIRNARELLFRPELMPRAQGAPP